MLFLGAAVEGNAWMTILFSSITGLVTIVTSFWFSRRKQKTDDFAAFMDESKDFRDEIRDELKRKQDEYDAEILRYKTVISQKEEELVALRRGNEDYIIHYKFISDFMPQILWTAAPDGEVNYYNSRWYEYTGLSLDQAQGWGWVASIHPDDIEQVKDKWKEALRTSHPLEHIIRLRKGRDATYHWFLCRATPRFDANGRVIQWIGTNTDVDDLMIQTRTP